MSKRIQQVNELLKREIAQIILKEIEFSKDILITVTRVETAIGQRQARVYISVMPEEKALQVIKILEKKIYEIQQRINKKLRMRPIPQIMFARESGTGEAGRIEELLEKIKNQK